METNKNTIKLKEGSKRGNSGYIEIYDMDDRYKYCIDKDVLSLNDLFHKIDGTVSLIINETNFKFPNDMPFDFVIKDNK
jgi:hypothetical protein